MENPLQLHYTSMVVKHFKINIWLKTILQKDTRQNSNISRRKVVRTKKNYQSRSTKFSEIRFRNHKLFANVGKIMK